MNGYVLSAPVLIHQNQSLDKGTALSVSTKYSQLKSKYLMEQFSTSVAQKR